MATSFSKVMFWTICFMGRPFGGVRPRRIYAWLGKRAYPRYDEGDSHWHKTHFGFQLYLNPYRLLDLDIIAFGTYDWPLHRALRQVLKAGDICMDVGANLGSVALYMAQLVGPRGTVYAFEPTPPICDLLRKNVARNDCGKIIRIQPLAVSNVSGPVLIRSQQVTGYNPGMASIVSKHAVLTEEYQARATTLDEFVAQENISRIDLIKIDIQGAEMFLLEGARETLRSLAPRLLMEVSAVELAATGMKPRDLLGLVESLGYRVYEVKPRRIGKRITAHEVASDFEANNVFCVKG